MAPQSSVDIHAVANECLTVFTTCNESPLLAQQDWFMRALEKFNLWCANLEATRSDKSSLDHRLGSRLDIQEGICNLLYGLATALERCHESIKQEADGTDDVPQRNLSHQHSDSSSELDKVSWDAMSYESSNAPSSAYEEASSQLLADNIFYVKNILDRLSRISLVIRQAGSEEPEVDGSSSSTGSFYSLPQVHPSQTDGPTTVVDDQILLHESALRALPPTEEPVVDGSSSSTRGLNSLPQMHPSQTDATTTSGAPEVTLDNVHAAFRTAWHYFAVNGISGPRPRFENPSFSSPAAEEIWQVHSTRLISLLNSLKFEIVEKLESDIQAKYEDAVHAIEEMKSAGGYFEERQPSLPTTVDQANKPKRHDMLNYTSAQNGTSEDLDQGFDAILQQAQADAYPSCEGDGAPGPSSGPSGPPDAPLDSTPMLDIDLSRFRMKTSSAFLPGTIFQVMWAEPRRVEQQKQAPIIPQEVKIIPDFFVGIRRFIVVASGDGNSCCVSILTYERRGCTKKGVNPRAHGIIHGAGHTPRLLRREPRLGFAPVAVSLISGERLVPESRVNYVKLQKVEHNVQAQIIGRVTNEHLPIVLNAVDDCWAARVQQTLRRDRPRRIRPKI